MSLQQRLGTLWEEIGPKSAEQFFHRARRDGIPATRAQVTDFVRNITARPSEIFQPLKQTGKAFSRGPSAEWKVDLMQFHKPSQEGSYYALVRLDSFSREADAVPRPSKSPAHVAWGLG